MSGVLRLLTRSIACLHSHTSAKSMQSIFIRAHPPQKNYQVHTKDKTSRTREGKKQNNKAPNNSVECSRFMRSDVSVVSGILMNWCTAKQSKASSSDDEQRAWFGRADHQRVTTKTTTALLPCSAFSRFVPLSLSLLTHANWPVAAANGAII